jgi:uncharacterized protein YbjT (DUF2867 family)
VLKFFETSTRNLLTREAAADVRHHVVLSVVGADRMSESGYMRAKIAQDATGGWGFGPFADGKPGAAAFMKSCFPCHEKTQATDLVFTRY